MGLLQSLGLAGASKAVRRLLRRSSHSSPVASASTSSRPQDAHHKTSPEQAAKDNSRPVKSLQTTQDEIVSQNGQEPDAMLSQKPSILPTTTRLAGASAHIQQDGKPSTAAEGSNKENARVAGPGFIEQMAGLELGGSNESQLEPQDKTSPNICESDDPVVQAEKARHQRFTEEALDMARLALRTNETPVGCVLVHGDSVIAKGMNATNVTRNGTRHAEFMALTALLSYPPKNGPRTTRLLSAATKAMAASTSDCGSIISVDSDKLEGNEDGSKGHLFPYGQKLHPDPIVDQGILRECVLYVTVEPCVMCASLLRQFGIKKVYFGAVNDKFGGTGGVFSIHANSDPTASSATPRPVSRQPPPLVGAAGTLGESFPPGGGDGGNVEKGYEIEGGWGRDEAVGLLRRFYVQENGRAPIPRKKEGRAARLMAIIDRTGPDAVCAALLSADGMLEMDKGPALAPIGDEEGNTSYDDLAHPNTAKTWRQVAVAEKDAELDKENVPIPG